MWSRPEANALVFEDETITWAHFGELVDQASSYLALHVPGDRIALSLPNSLDLAFAIFGSIRAEKAVQVLDPSWPDALMRSVLERLCSDFALTSSNVDAFSRHLSSGDRLASMINRDVPHRIAVALIFFVSSRVNSAAPISQLIC